LLAQIKKLKPYLEQISLADKRSAEEDESYDFKLEKKPKILDLSKDNDSEDDEDYQDWLKLAEEIDGKNLDKDIFPSSTQNN